MHFLFLQEKVVKVMYFRKIKEPEWQIYGKGKWEVSPKTWLDFQYSNL